MTHRRKSGEVKVIVVGEEGAGEEQLVMDDGGEGYLHLDYLREFQLNKRLDFNQRVYRFSRALFRCLGVISCVDLCARIELHRKNSAYSTIVTDHTESSDAGNWRWSLKNWSPELWSLLLRRRVIKLSAWRQREGHNWITDLLLVLYTVSILHLLANLYYQYSLDFNLVRLRQIRERVTSRHDEIVLKSHLLEQEDDARRALKSIGAPHMHLSFTIECLYVYIIVYSLTAFYVTYLRHRLVVPLDLHMMRDLLEFEEEQRHEKLCIQSQVLKFLESARIHAKMSSIFVMQVGEIFSLEKELNDEHKLDGQFQPGRESLIWTSNTLTRMLTAGALRPFNKSPPWIEKRTRAMFTFMVSLLAYVALLFVQMIGAAFAQSDPLRSLTWRDSILLFSFACPLVISSLASSLYGACYFIVCYDQIMLVKKIQSMVKICIHRNQLEFIKLKRSRFNQRQSVRERMRASENIIQKMNTNFLFVILHHKLFASQYYPLRRSLDAASLFISILVLSFPLIMKIHLTYYEPADRQQARVAAAFLSSTLLIPANINISPICYLYCRCVDLYRTLTSLSAHIVEVESQTSDREIYNRHAVAVLLKELRSPDQLMDQFKPRTLGLSGTYTTWVRTHFWWGLIVISILCDSQAGGGQELFSSLFNDPLNVF